MGEVPLYLARHSCPGHTRILEHPTDTWGFKGFAPVTSGTSPKLCDIGPDSRKLLYTTPRHKWEFHFCVKE